MNTLYHQEDISLVGNNFGFLRQTLNFEPHLSDADWVITGVPFDMATSGRSGARFGAQAIRNASINLAWEKKRFPYNFALTDKIKIVDCGDLVFKSGDAHDLCQRLTSHATNLLNHNKKMLTLGGDHFISLPLLRAHALTHGKMALIHFDAHTDTYANGSIYDHGTMFYHAVIEELILPSNSIQIGIRTEYDDLGFTVLDAPLANDLSVKEIVDTIKHCVGNLPIYLSFDIDCLDPAFAPGTGTPVCGGLSTDKVLKIIRNLKDLPIIGMDIVEVAPAYDCSDITALAAATIALELLYINTAGKI